MKYLLIYGLGFLSQILFFARTIVQWFKSEHEGEVISPVIYWQLSLVASLLMLTYGILRDDFAIVLGQFLVYFIYIRNLQLKKAWKSLPVSLKPVLIILPFLFIFWLIFGSEHNWNRIITNKNVSVFLMAWGSVGQVVFTFRFVYQWITSENKKDSVLPIGFWIISTIGSVMIFIYAVLRLDPVLFAAHSVGIFIYIRNILLYKGKTSIFNRLNMPRLKEFSQKVSDKIK